jgi:hypothetical protein
MSIKAISRLLFHSAVRKRLPETRVPAISTAVPLHPDNFLQRIRAQQQLCIEAKRQIGKRSRDMSSCGMLQTLWQARKFSKLEAEFEQIIQDLGIARRKAVSETLNLDLSVLIQRFEATKIKLNLEVSSVGLSIGVSIHDLQPKADSTSSSKWQSKWFWIRYFLECILS